MLEDITIEKSKVNLHLYVGIDPFDFIVKISSNKKNFTSKKQHYKQKTDRDNKIFDQKWNRKGLFLSVNTFISMV